MKKIIISGVVVWCALPGNSQQLTQLSQYHMNHFVVNPAAMGLNDQLDLNLSFRQQWVGFDNAPQTYYFSGHALLGGAQGPKYNPSLRTSHRGPVKAPTVKTGKLKHSVGGNVMMDKYGPFQRLNFNGAYAIHVPLSKSMNLSCGIGIGGANLTFDQSKVTMLNPNDATYSSFLGTGGTQQKFLADLNTGLYLYSQYLFVGYSTSQVLQQKMNFGDVTNAKLKTHHYIIGGYRIDINEDWCLIPNTLVKFMQPAPVAMDFNLRANYLDKFYMGVSYRHKDAVVGFAGLQYNGFKLGYSYDYTISTLRKHNSGGHEVVVGYVRDLHKK
ncbi:MAG TPA: type IX secretion system membrane protein PorP/SprF [Flavobacteriales bacterium]|nr:type IX secretion system membrane protein PorP/SprF [Flavobacteriales bacterium]